MAEKIYMTNLKGGTGVTTCALGLAFSLSKLGARTLVVDGDRYAASGAVIGGCANMQVYTLGDYEKGACRAKQTIISHPDRVNLCLCSSLGVTDEKSVMSAVEELDGLFDYILCDKCAKLNCDRAIIVTEPYLPSIKCSDSCRALLSDGGIKDIFVLVNKLNGGQIIDGDVLSAEEIASILHLPLIGVIPEDLTLPLGRCKKSTFKAFCDAADAVLGRAHRVCNVIKPYCGINGLIKRKVRQRI